jgi:hypothetical protein
LSETETMVRSCFARFVHQVIVIRFQTRTSSQTASISATLTSTSTTTASVSPSSTLSVTPVCLLEGIHCYLLLIRWDAVCNLQSHSNTFKYCHTDADANIDSVSNILAGSLWPGSYDRS